MKKEGVVRGGDHLKESVEMGGKDSSSERVKISSHNYVFEKRRTNYWEKHIQM